MSGRGKPCRHGCGKKVTAETMLTHERLFCAAITTKAQRMRTCKRPGCKVRFELRSTHPNQEFCTRQHGLETTRGRAKARGYAPVKKAHLDLEATEMEQEDLRYAPMRLREAEVALAARRLGAAIEASRERSHALWMELLKPERRVE